MTTTHAAAQAELTHAGRPVSQEESDRWLKKPAPLAIGDDILEVRVNGKVVAPKSEYLTAASSWSTAERPGRFDPATPVSPLAARLLKVSNAASFSGLHRDGAFDEVGASRHARFGFHWGR